MTNTKMEISDYLHFNGLGLESSKIEEIAIAVDKCEGEDSRSCEMICLIQSAVEEEENENLYDDEDEE